MANLRELLWQTRDLLDERATPTQWRDYQLRRWLDEAQRDFVLRALGAGKKRSIIELLERATGTTSNGVADYSLPADFLALESAYLNSIACREVSVGAPFLAPMHAFGPSATQDPEVAIVDSGLARFYPTPGSGTPAYQLYYWKRPLSLWQQVATFEVDETWTGTGVSSTTSNLTGSEEEGTTRGALLTAGGAGTITASRTLSPAVDFGADTTDVVEVFVNSDLSAVTDVRLQFHKTDGVDYYTATVLAGVITASGGYVRVPKSSFTTGGGTPSWTSVAAIKVLLTASGAETATFDDFRIYRAPEIDVAAHGLLCSFAAARALQSDEGFRNSQDAANLMLDYEAKVKAYLG